MLCELNYGRGSLSVDLPEDLDVTILRKPIMPVLRNPREAVSEALAHPLNSAPLSELAQKAQSAAIAICDITRPVPNHLFLRPLIETLAQAGIPRRNITVLIATGLHRPNLGAELEELIGDPWVLQNVRIENHYARNDDEHVLLGSTKTRGTVVRIDKRFIQADLKIVTGLVEPHFMAGYSGGRKVIAPGLAHAETITTFHSARFMADPCASNCSLESNPLHEEQLEIVRMLRGALAVNTVIDEERRLSFVNFGEIIDSHLSAVEFSRKYAEVSVDRRFHTVVTSGAGYPLDKTYYQTVKGMVAPLDILQPGGRLIIASECSEGLGSDEFVESQRRLVKLGPEEFLRSIMPKSHAAIDEWQTQMQLKSTLRGRVQLYSTGLSKMERQLTGVECIDSVTAAIVHSVAESGERSVAVVPEGPYVIPFRRGHV
jgi:nickel-dependent lactate racemase